VVVFTAASATPRRHVPWCRWRWRSS